MDRLVGHGEQPEGWGEYRKGSSARDADRDVERPRADGAVQVNSAVVVPSSGAVAPAGAGTFKPEFTQLLACPRCGERFQLEAERLNCPAGHSYPIKDGVPRFVESEWYAENFGFEWNVHSTTQLDDEADRESEETFVQKTGFTAEDLKGKLVLDVGCGMGRFSDVVSRWGGRVVGIDLTTAVDAANRNLGGRPNVYLAQANVFELPFAPETFDYIFSIGVLHHTPSTKRAFDQLPKLLKPGGKIAIWVYSTRMRRWCWTSDFYRIVTTRLPKRTLHRLSHIANPMYLLHKWLEPRSSRLDAGFFLLLPCSRHDDPDWRVLDTFDWYSPKYQFKHSDDELRDWFTAQGLTELKTLDFETSLQGTKPAGG